MYARLYFTDCILRVTLELLTVNLYVLEELWIRLQVQMLYSRQNLSDIQTHFLCELFCTQAIEIKFINTPNSYCRCTLRTFRN